MEEGLGGGEEEGEEEDGEAEDVGGGPEAGVLAEALGGEEVEGGLDDGVHAGRPALPRGRLGGEGEAAQLPPVVNVHEDRLRVHVPVHQVVAAVEVRQSLADLCHSLLSYLTTRQDSDRADLEDARLDLQLGQGAPLAEARQRPPNGLCAERHALAASLAQSERCG